MISPTIGRVVHYYAGGKSYLKSGRQPFAAIVACVQSDTLVNLTVCNERGETAGVQNVRLVQEGEDYPESPFCCWMPYQIGQAKNTENMPSWIDKIDRRFYEAEKRLAGLEEFVSRPDQFAPMLLSDGGIVGDQATQRPDHLPDLSAKATGYVDEAEKPE